MRARRGGVALAVALSLLVIFGLLSLVLDIGYARLVHTQLQAATDAAALAGSARLDGSAEGIAEARRTAVAVAALNDAHGDTIILDPNPTNGPGGAVVLGVWDGASLTASTDPDVVNAVRVRAMRDGLVPLFSRLLDGANGLGAAAIATAVRGEALGAGEVPYYLPFGIPQCMLDSEEGVESITFVLNPAGVDNTGWALVGGSPNTRTLQDLLLLATVCMQQWYDTGEISAECATAWTGETVGLSDGEMTAALQTIAELIASHGIPWSDDIWGPLPEQDAWSDVPAGAYGNMLAGPFPVFDGGDGYCHGEERWVGDAALTGYVWGAIYDVRWRGPAARKNIWARLDLTSLTPIGDWWGGGSWGITTTGPPRLVE